MHPLRIRNFLILVGAFLLAPFTAFADTIDPTAVSANLGVGDSITVRKTVVVEEGPGAAGKLDVHFLFDTSGSMGAEINAAKSAANAIMTALSAYSADVAVGVGVFSEGAHYPYTAPGSVINQDLTTDLSLGGTAQNAINAVTLNYPDGGGDYPERGQDAVKIASDNVSWRAGSKRVIIALGDASWKNDITSDAAATAALGAANADLIGLAFGTTCFTDADSDDCSFSQSVTDLGGTVYASTASTSSIVNNITSGLGASFANYGVVTVGDLGNGLPDIAVSTVCVSADIGTCAGSDAVGAYDRSVDRTFEFDVTFTRIGGGDTTFDTYALVDGVGVATEVDHFTVAVPAPGALLMFGLGLLGLGAARRRTL